MAVEARSFLALFIYQTNSSRRLQLPWQISQLHLLRQIYARVFYMERCHDTILLLLNVSEDRITQRCDLSTGREVSGKGDANSIHSTMP